MIVCEEGSSAVVQWAHSTLFLCLVIFIHSLIHSFTHSLIHRVYHIISYLSCHIIHITCNDCFFRVCIMYYVLCIITMLDLFGYGLLFQIFTYSTQQQSTTLHYVL